ncbi:glycosyltransferase [Prosthecobacter sp.]|uniref:glycosyltransferase n=1 Tax=Prosthecobacter sp. TaxID=1965333 RepID=UPI00378512DE
MNHRSKLLLISEVGCGPPFLGNRARVKSLIAELKSLGFELHFAGVNMTPEEKAGTLPCVDRWAWDFAFAGKNTIGERLQRRWNKLNGSDKNLRQGTDVSVDRWMQHRWMDEAKKLQRREKYDVVLVEYVFHSAFLECFPGSLRILDTHDVFSNRNQRLAEAGIADQWFSTHEADEAHALKRADRILAIQNKEAGFFRSLAGEQAAVFTVGHISETQPLQLPAGGPPRIGYLSSDNPLNVKSFTWFLNEVWPQVHARTPSAELHVAGGICRALTPFAGGRLLGPVSSTRSFYDSVDFTINPMQAGTGLKIKTIESMAYGRATIGTSIACEGIEDYVGRGLEMTDSSADFTAACHKYIDDRAAVQEGARQAVAAVEEMNTCWRSDLRSAFNRSSK